MVERSPQGLQRRVVGYHDIRLDGIHDLVLRARGASVLDVGCNRGLVGFEFANNGASVVHGCDNWEPGIAVARELFCDLRNVESRFEVVDLTKGAGVLNKAFGKNGYDIVLLLAVIHKIARVMSEQDLSGLVQNFGRRTIKYLGWRSTAADKPGNAKELERLDRDLGAVGLKRIQTSTISELGPAAIWERT